MKKTKQDSTTTILHIFRKQFAEKQRFEKVVSTVMLWILLIEFGVAYVLKGQVYSDIAILGLVLTFGWLVYATVRSVELQDHINNIDEFYLELSMQVKKNETKNKSK